MPGQPETPGLTRLLARIFGTLAAVFLAAMVLLTVADIAHLVVDVIDHLARPGIVRLIDLVGALVSLGVLVVMAWQMLPLARTMHEFGDVTRLVGEHTRLVRDWREVSAICAVSLP